MYNSSPLVRMHTISQALLTMIRLNSCSHTVTATCVLPSYKNIPQPICTPATYWIDVAISKEGVTALILWLECSIDRPTHGLPSLLGMYRPTQKGLYHAQRIIGGLQGDGSHFISTWPVTPAPTASLSACKFHHYGTLVQGFAQRIILYHPHK